MSKLDAGGLLTIGLAQQPTPAIKPSQHDTVAEQDALTLAVMPRAGAHLETLAFYFPVVNQKHAELVLHWGTVVVPLSIDVP